MNSLVRFRKKAVTKAPSKLHVPTTTRHLANFYRNCYTFEQTDYHQLNGNVYHLDEPKRMKKKKSKQCMLLFLLDMKRTVAYLIVIMSKHNNKPCIIGSSNRHYF